jgi:hypothetical protein
LRSHFLKNKLAFNWKTNLARFWELFFLQTNTYFCFIGRAWMYIHILSLQKLIKDCSSAEDQKPLFT